MDGWLIGVNGLQSRRAPGNTCLSALMRAAPYRQNGTANLILTCENA